jgi:hypothetical protein
MINSNDLHGIMSRRREVSPRAQLLYLFALDELRDGKPFPSIGALQGALGVTKRAVYLLLAELVECGEVVKLDRGVFWINAR